jgi:Tfp pilus assembly protein PilF
VSPYLAIVAVVFLVHGPTLVFDFVSLDDDQLVLRDHAFLRDPSNVAQAFRRDVFGTGTPAYRPFLTLSLMLDAWMGGKAPLVYHVSNVVLHALATIGVFLVLIASGYPRGPSTLASVIFAVHPLLTPAVAWIPGRNDSLLAVFALAAWIAFVRYARSGSWPAYAAHVALFAGALFTKETALALPCLSLVYLGLFARASLRSRRTTFLAAGWLGAIVVWWGLRATALAGSKPAPVTVEALATNARAVLELLGAIVLPLQLPVYPTFSMRASVTGIVVILGVAAAAWLARPERRTHLVFGATWFIALLMPTLAFRETPAAFDYLHHRVYLPLVGVTIVALEIVQGRRVPLGAPARARLAVAVAVVLAGLTIVHARQYRDGVTFWSAAVAAAPRSAEARHSLGHVLHMRGDLAGAEAGYRAAIELRPADPAASPKYYVNLGMVYEAKGIPAEAMRKYEEAIALAPDFAPAHLNLGTIRYREGRLPEAEAEYVRALALDPRLVLAHVNMCAIRFHQQRLVEAEGFCRKALELQRDSERALLGLAIVQYYRGRHLDASRSVDELRSRGVAVERIIPEVVAGLRARRR